MKCEVLYSKRHINIDIQILILQILRLNHKLDVIELLGLLAMLFKGTVLTSVNSRFIKANVHIRVKSVQTDTNYKQIVT